MKKPMMATATMALALLHAPVRAQDWPPGVDAVAKLGAFIVHAQNCGVRSGEWVGQARTAVRLWLGNVAVEGGGSEPLTSLAERRARLARFDHWVEEGRREARSRGTGYCADVPAAQELLRLDDLVRELPAARTRILDSLERRWQQPR